MPYLWSVKSIKKSINQSIQSYIALLYIPEVAVQSPESSCHSYTVIPVVVSYLSSHTHTVIPVVVSYLSCHSYTVIPVVVSYISSHSCPGAEAWLPISAYGPSDPHQHSFIFIHIHTMQCMSL